MPGSDVQQNGMNTPFRDDLLVDADGKLPACPWRCIAPTPRWATLHQRRAASTRWSKAFYANAKRQTRGIEVASGSHSPTIGPGMSRFFADQTADPTGAPFVTEL